MTYNVNLHKHVKIWISADKDVFLPAKNQARLKEMREINPKDTITFFYDGKILSPKALEDLRTFCTQNNIIAKDVRNALFPQCQTQDKLRMVECYEQEITNLKNGGNLGAASDILRLLTYPDGNYSDLDVVVDTRDLPPTLVTKQPIILSLGSSRSIDRPNIQFESLVVNNDVILVSNSSETDTIMKKLRENLYKAYIDNPFKKEMTTYLHEYKSLCSIPQLADLNYQDLIDHCTVYQELRMLNTLFRTETTPWELRKFINSLTEKQIPSAEIYKHNLLMRSVINTTGSALYSRLLFGETFKLRTTVAQDVEPYSLSHYDLTKNFKSTNAADFCMTQSHPYFTSVGGDLSWTQMGKAQLDKESLAISAQGKKAFFDTKIENSCKITLTQLTQSILQQEPSAHWKFYSESKGTTGKPGRVAQILFTSNSKERAEEVFNYLKKNSVEGLKPVAKVQNKDLFVLTLLEPNLSMLQKLPAMQQLMEEKHCDHSSTSTSLSSN